MTSLLSIITPINLEIEKDKFLASKTYNPLFEYDWQGSKVEPIMSSKNMMNLWPAIKSQNHEQIVAAASLIFETKIDDSVLKLAKRDSGVKGKKSSGTAEEYAQLMREGLEYFGLGDVEVVLTDQSGFNARPQHRDKKLLVSRHIHFEYFSMEGSAHHELVHCLRYYNRKQNQIKLDSNYLPTEEGLASWCQDNTNDDNGLAQHAMEYVATSVGLLGSLRDVYNCMCDLGMSSELAWKRASRHKFGFVDTSIPGDILKPAMYYANELKVGKLTTNEKLRLFVGKIALGDLSLYPTYVGLWPADQIIEYFNLEGQTLQVTQVISPRVPNFDH